MEQLGSPFLFWRAFRGDCGDHSLIVASADGGGFRFPAMAAHATQIVSDSMEASWLNKTHGVASEPHIAVLSVANSFRWKLDILGKPLPLTMIEPKHTIRSSFTGIQNLPMRRT
jgi:hypothetical protein